MVEYMELGKKTLIFIYPFWLKIENISLKLCLKQTYKLINKILFLTYKTKSSIILIYLKNGDVFPNTRVSGAWRQGLNGSGITIAVLDDGIQVDHPDLRKNIVRIIYMMLVSFITWPMNTRFWIVQYFNFLYVSRMLLIVMTS